MSLRPSIFYTANKLADLSFPSAFKYFFRSYGERLEKRTVQYAALARIIREGGLVIAVVVRYSVIPNHCEACFEYDGNLL